MPWLRQVWSTTTSSTSAEGVPRWAHLDPDAVRIPLPEIQIIGGGAHAVGTLDLQDLPAGLYLVLTTVADVMTTLLTPKMRTARR